MVAESARGDKKLGEVVKVSGPVVIAKGLTGAKMFDVVRVGALGMVGEIIRLIGDEATIQVYEDTTGVRPGDKVENTGEALSVELGPGLLTSIYDGVQRPLDVLKSQGGDFIKRGFVAAPLDEKRVWEFSATKKPGETVLGGDVLGTVQETNVILHKILVPPGASGTLVSLASGRYTVHDPIGKLKTESGEEIPLRLSQRWQVRVQRPTTRKLPPVIPLITGQRIIDTMFPVAKGGTAAIPGPFGSGKCVAGETPVQLADGQIVSIQQVYQETRKEGELRREGNDEWLRVPNPVELYSMVGDKFVRSQTRTLYKGKSDSLVRIRTRSGRTVRVTPVHKLFRIDAEGQVQETMARDLVPGQYLAAARRLPSPSGTVKLDVDLPPLQRAGKYIRIPKMMTPELAEFLGLYVAEGYIRGSATLVFTNTDSVLRERFLALGKELFGLTGKVEFQPGKAPNVLLMSRLLVDFVGAMGAGRLATEKAIPSSVLRSSSQVVSAFLRGYFLGDGSYYDGNVELCTASKHLLTQLVYVMSRFEVLTNQGTKHVQGTPYYRIFIRGVRNLERFAGALDSSAPKISRISEYVRSQRTSYTSTDVVPLSPAAIERLYRAHTSYSALVKSGIEVHNYIGNSERMGTRTFGTFMEVMSSDGDLAESEPNAFRLWHLLDDILCDEISEVVVESEGPYDVYDFVLADYGANFVGGFGGIVLHNTVNQQQLAKWSEADVVVYVGCGERGNEMTEILTEFPHLEDPKTKRPLMERTILIANTSNMPVAAREASIYTGITIAEYYRDMGYDVALMADSTSRWAEALREISGRLEEMPGEEGYPAYLGRRLAEFYERSGRVIVVGSDEKQGSVTVIGAVSPPGGDTSEPVSQNTLRVTRVFWALDASLANRRHFPSINWLNSYSLYLGDLGPWYSDRIAREWTDLRNEAMSLLQKEAELQEIVQLVGADALPEKEKGVLDVARMIREDYLQQSAYDEVDAYSSIQKQYKMLRNILQFGHLEMEALDRGVPLTKITTLPVREKIAKMKTTSEKEGLDVFDKILEEAKSAVGGLKAEAL